MNIAYLYLGKLSIGSGVHKKIVMQIKQWESMGHKVKVYHASIDRVNTFKDDSINSTFEHISNIMLYRVGFCDEIKNFADVAYMRYSFICLDIWNLMRHVPTFVEINSNEEEEYKLDWHKNFKSKVKCLWNFFNRFCLMSVAKGKVCVTYELSKREKQKNPEIPSVVIPNAIMENFRQRKQRLHDIPVLIFIGSPNQEWHGVDKILELAKQTVDSLHFILIGPDLKNMKLGSNVEAYGILAKSEYAKFFAIADVGISTLALHRNGMDEACSLKTREYLSWGLPVIIGYEDTAFIGKNDYKWICKLPNVEDNVSNNIEIIKEFAYKAKNMHVTEDMLKDMTVGCLEKKRLDFIMELGK